MARKSVADAICKSDRVSLEGNFAGFAKSFGWSGRRRPLEVISWIPISNKDERRDNSGDLVQLYSTQHEGASVIDDM